MVKKDKWCIICRGVGLKYEGRLCTYCYKAIERMNNDCINCKGGATRWKRNDSFDLKLMERIIRMRRCISVLRKRKGIIRRRPDSA